MSQKILTPFKTKPLPISQKAYDMAEARRIDLEANESYAVSEEEIKADLWAEYYEQQRELNEYYNQ